MRDYLAKLMNLENLTSAEMEKVTKLCLSEDITDTEIAALLTALHMKGETAEEIASIANVISAQSDLSDIALTNAMDNCGTGGDRSNSFNISTTAAFVLAGAGVTVAKHGNRSISSKTGSADVLEHLGISLNFSKAQTKKMLTENNISFLFAPNVHKSLVPFMKVRRELGLPTVFNIIGPLTNPIALETQLVGIYDKSKMDIVAAALGELGRKRALVVHGAGGMDEASLSGENHLVLLEDGEIKSFTLHPHDLGLKMYDNEAIRGGTPKENAAILLSVLNNEPGPYLDTVLLNTALSLFANGKTKTIEAGIDLARESIASGAALDRLNTLVEYSRENNRAIS